MAKSCKRRAEHCSWCSGQGVSILGLDPGSQKAVDPHSFGTPGTGPNIKHLVPLTWNLNVLLSQGKNVAENPLWTHLDSWESQIWVQISPSQLSNVHASRTELTPVPDLAPNSSVLMPASPWESSRYCLAHRKPGWERPCADTTALQCQPGPLPLCLYCLCTLYYYY